MASRIDKEKVKKSISVVLDKLRNEADPALVDEYRSIIKKEVSFFRRSWVAAYLLMQFEQGSSGFRGTQGRMARNRGFQSDYRQENNGEPRVRQYPLAEEDSKRLFISVGRNRRVFPREILGLIIAKTGADRDDIGAIRILESYSFVQVRETIADKIIEALNGYNFRGRTLAVNYAKSRKDEEDSAEDAAESSGDFSEMDEQDQPVDDDVSEQGPEQEQYYPDK